MEKWVNQIPLQTNAHSLTLGTMLFDTYNAMRIDDFCIWCGCNSAYGCDSVCTKRVYTEETSSIMHAWYFFCIFFVIDFRSRRPIIMMHNVVVYVDYMKDVQTICLALLMLHAVYARSITFVLIWLTTIVNQARWKAIFIEWGQLCGAKGMYTKYVRKFSEFLQAIQVFNSYRVWVFSYPIHDLEEISSCFHIKCMKNTTLSQKKKE